ncbi:unnamed protein product [Lactuca virosa]|uniref:Protein kinase domain-containing protein n=1 Tax=Lactuca virosa TaxID=75947 RepID=A0AAU9MHV6_9ASTR|nr:unnamed protein product [Lactuca virosa]
MPLGVVLFEVLSGKQAVDSSLDEEHWGLVNWAQESIREDSCLHNNPKQRPTIAEVVACLESVLALQEKANYTLHPPGMKIFGNKVPMFLSSFIEDKSVGSKRSLDIYFGTIGGENRILRRFEFQTIIVATENFSETNKISAWGDGEIEAMYKGRLQNGQGVLIARHDSNSYYQEYKNEVSLLVQLEHENLLHLLGYSIGGTQVFLVYEFAVYASLDRLIKDHECTLLDWNKRNKIILGVARALLYLHQHGPFRIIHCGVNPENILLDESLDPKLSSFGFARCLAISEADCIKEKSVGGIPGYIAPEVYQTYRLSTKADVYSFGVLILVTITGCTVPNHYLYNSSGHMTFEEYVWTNWLDETSSDIIDPRIDVDSSSITRVIHIGLLCVQADPADRPTMEECFTGSEIKENVTLLKIAEEKVGRKRCLELYFETIGGEHKTLRRFEFGTINVATEKFSENNKISRWGSHDFIVYKGRLQNGQGVSIARHNSGSRSQDYKNEVALLVKLEHENLLKLLGYSIEGTQVFLIDEFAVCESLDHMLFDRGCTLLDWNKREKIILAVARVLVYLHQHDVIHGNVTPGIILLDESFDPKLSDFRHDNQLSTKDDVYKFGVLILETMTGYNIH